MNIISGENLQALSQISLCTEVSNIIAAQLKHKPQNLHRINDISVEEIKRYSTIFCYTHDIDVFFDKFFNHINCITLITHNSDNSIDGRYEKYLNSDKIKRWYCQNRYFSHPKLTSIPIGIANSQWLHGDQQLIKKIRDTDNKKNILVYKNFDINTNSNERHICNNITTNNGIPFFSSQPIDEYWHTMSKSVFIISPPGNGIDCHRIWEALYLKCVPIVKMHEAFEQFKHLPILFINDWEEVTIDFLNTKANSFIYNEQLFDIPLLDINFWKKNILDT